MLDRHGERAHVEAVDDAADDVRGPVAEERAAEHLDLQARRGDERPRHRATERAQQVAQVAAEILEAALEAQVEHDVDQRMAQAAAARVVAAVGRRVGVEVLGRDGGPHEQEAVVEVRAVQDLAGHRVEERLGALGLPVLDQHADVVQLDPRPQRVGAAAAELDRAELALDALGRLLDAPVVEVDPVARDMADREEVAGLEMLLRGARAIAEQRVVLVESFEQRQRDRAGGVVRGRGDRELGLGAGGHHGVERRCARRPAAHPCEVRAMIP